MNKLLRRRPSASMVVAMAALVLAASGTAVAAGGLVSGDNLIKKHSLSGNRLRNFTITRRQVNLSKLGTVPKASDATFATAAGSATTASNANTLDGLQPSAFDAASNTTRTGLVGAQANTSVTLGSFGPFTLTLKCIVSGGMAEAQVMVASSQSGSEVQGSLLPAGSTITDAGPDSSFVTSNDSGVDFISPSQGQFFGDVLSAVNYPGNPNPCVAMALVSKS